MFEDPLTRWPGQFPYRVLADFGITPRSTQAEVKDVVFTLMAEDMMNPTTQRAAGELRDLAGRLLADLLLYDVGEEAELDRLDERIAHELADPGEPAEVTEALTTIPIELLEGLADELAEEPNPPAGPGAFPTPSFLDRLIQFDR
jgi:hypothetical protein